MSVFEYVRAGASAMRVVRPDESHAQLATKVVAHASGRAAELEIADGDVAVVIDGARACGVLGPGRHLVSAEHAPNLAGEGGALDVTVVYVTLEGTLATYLPPDDTLAMPLRSRFDVRVLDPATLALAMLGAEPRDVNAWICHRVESVPNGADVSLGLVVRGVSCAPATSACAVAVLFVPTVAPPTSDHRASVSAAVAAVPTRCTKCDAPLHGARYCVECAAPAMQSEVCTSCDAQLVRGSKFCHRCGARVGA